MSWPPLRGHQEVVERFRRAQRRGRLASTFLFVGPPGVGKRTFAIRLAATLLCERNDPAELEPCGVCPACQQVMAGTHPDFAVVSKPADKSFIPIELLIGDREHRGRAGLCHYISLKPSRGGYRIAIIDDGDDLNVEGANCLLKNLEEPPPNSILILIATSQSTQLPTIRSRCQIVRFGALSEHDVAELLVENELCPDPTAAADLARLAHGSIEAALAQTTVQAFRDSLLEVLSRGAFDSVACAADITKHVNSAGKEAPVRRRSLRELILLTTNFYRQLMRRLCSQADSAPPPEIADPGLTKAVDAACGIWRGGPESAAQCIERCIDAQEQLESNANLATLIECWVDDLSLLAQGKRLVS